MEFVVYSGPLGTRSNAFLALFSLAGDGTCRLQTSAKHANTLVEFQLATAPLLQFPADTLPSLHPGKCFQARGWRRFVDAEDFDRS